MTNLTRWPQGCGGTKPRSAKTQASFRSCLVHLPRFHRNRPIVDDYTRIRFFRIIIISSTLLLEILLFIDMRGVFCSRAISQQRQISLFLVTKASIFGVSIVGGFTLISTCLPAINFKVFFTPAIQPINTQHHKTSLPSPLRHRYFCRWGV